MQTLRLAFFSDLSARGVRVVHGVTGEILRVRPQRLISGELWPPERSSSGLQVPRAVTASSLSLWEWRHQDSLIPTGLVSYETFGSIDLTQAAAVARRQVGKAQDDPGTRALPVRILHPFR